MRKLQIGILLSGVALVIGGAVAGIVLPIVDSATSGESLLATEIAASDSQTIALSPEMNPLRARIVVSYDAPGRRLSGHHSLVSATMTLRDTSEQIWSIDTGFSDDDHGSDDQTVDAGLENRTVNLQEFSIESAGEYALSTDVKLNDSFTLRSVTLELLRNVEPIQWPRVVAGALAICVGIATILMTAFWMLKNPRAPQAFHGLQVPDLPEPDLDVGD